MAEFAMQPCPSLYEAFRDSLTMLQPHCQHEKVNATLLWRKPMHIERAPIWLACQTIIHAPLVDPQKMNETINTHTLSQNMIAKLL